MTLRSWFFYLFPALQLALTLVTLVVAPWLVVLPVYALPLVLAAAHERLWPTRGGAYKLVHGGYVPWWSLHRLQWWFIAVPALEAPLLAVPGMFAWWLRAWGAKVGARVEFSPGLVLGDRSLLDIGEGAVFGYGVRVSGHIVKPTADGQDLLCVVRAVKIGAGAFVGAGVVLGPGAQIDDGAVVDAGTSVVGTRHRKKAP